MSVLLALIAIGAPATAWSKSPRPKAEPNGAARDWSRHPAIVEVATPEDVFALGDVHGAHERLAALLVSAGLIKPDGPSEAGYAWAGGKRVLVVVGDVIDKADQSLASIDLLIALEAGAEAAGGRVIVTIGNHEAEFLADPSNKKAKREFDKELTAHSLDREEVAAGRGRYGEWLVHRPLAAKVNGWFFAHGGRTDGSSISALADAYRKAVDSNNWGSKALVGKDSILKAQKWWKAGTIDASLTALGARHIVFGHDPGAFEAPGSIIQRFEGKLFKIDVGMSPAVDFSHGALLLIHATESGEEATSVDAAGKSTSIWKGSK